jgi:ribosomal protein S18 acetylase RimI-like enzyme
VTWYIRRMQSDDIESFLDFLSNWVQDGLRDRYRWIYQNNPHGKALTWLAINKNSNGIIGCTSIFPKKLSVHNRFVPGSVGGDTYVDPQYRRQGIAQTLHKVSRVDMRDNGIRLLYGFLDAENLGAFRKAGAYLPGSFVTARLFLSTKAVIRKAKLTWLLPEPLISISDRVYRRIVGIDTLQSRLVEYTVSEFSGFDDSFETLSGEIASSVEICCVRDIPYLRWRFLDHPSKHYKLLYARRKDNDKVAGFAAVEISDNTAQISDIFGRTDDGSFEALLIALINFCLSKSLQKIWLMVNPSGLHCRILLSLGFRLDHSDLKALGVLGDTENDTIENLGNWYLTAADLDI